ncbi:MAG: alpha/beta hydrolase [Chloroflexi bacterium]|nr:MAG: alpha/beta hydrolase [Chloroflexota bacterium]
MPRVIANGIQIGYEQHGEGPHLLLITGVAYDRWFWHKVVPGLAAHFTVTVFDNRGAGESDKPAGPYTVDMMAADTAALLDELGIEKTAVLGHSLGGFIAQRLVATHSDRVSHLILAGTHHGGQNIVPITPEALDVLTNRQGDPLELLRRGVAIAAAPGFAEKHPERFQEIINYRLTNPVPPAQYTAQVMAGVGTGNWSEEQVAAHMAAIQMPTLILFGEHDRVVPPGNAELFAAKIPQAEVCILPGTGHIFPLEDPEGTVTAVLDFLLRHQ